MSSKILMPALSPTMTEGIINQWLVKVGDNVKAGDVIAEIETDKATMEVEAVDEGKITHLLEDTENKQIPVLIFQVQKYNLTSSFTTKQLKTKVFD